MNPISEGLSLGYTEDQILNFISQKYPAITKKIAKALKMGHEPKNILNFLAPFFSQFQSNPSIKASSPQDAYRQQRRHDIEMNKKLVKDALITAGTIGGGALAGRALQNVAPRIGNAVGGLFKTPQQTAEAPVAEAMGAQAQAPNIPIPPPAPKPIAEEEVYEKTKNLLRDLKISPKIFKLLDKNAPENIPAILDKLVSGDEKAMIEKETGLPFSESIQKFSKFVKKDIDKLSNKGIKQQFEAFHGEIPNQPKILPTKEAQKGGTEAKMVALPDGQVGTLLEERQGIGSVEMPDGKVRRLKSSDLELEPPEVTQEVITAVQDLLKIPEVERSSVFNTTTYEPASKRMQIRFHNGETVEYDDVDEEVFNAITHGNRTATTKGGNIFGVFSPEDIEKSRGSTFHKEIRMNPKYAKSNEGKTWRYLRKGYVYWKGLERETKKRKRKEES